MDQVLDASTSLLQYCRNSQKPFYQHQLQRHLNTTFKNLTSIEWTYHPTSDEVIQYYNSYAANQTIPEDTQFRNSELYMFIRSFILLCALDTYGRCETVEQTEASIERGRAFLQGGILTILKCLPTWTTYKQDFDDWNLTMNFLLKTKYAPWFTKLDAMKTIDSADHARFKQEWNGILQEAFDQLKE
jgi:hypothetical protein